MSRTKKKIEGETTDRQASKARQKEKLEHRREKISLDVPANVPGGVLKKLCFRSNAAEERRKATCQEKRFFIKSFVIQ